MVTAQKDQEERWWKALTLAREALDIVDKADNTYFPDADLRVNELVVAVEGLRQDYNKLVFGHA